jgi:hypothetical protein
MCPWLHAYVRRGPANAHGMSAFTRRNVMAEWASGNSYAVHRCALQETHPLPSAKLFRALGKERHSAKSSLPSVRRSAKSDTRQRNPLSSVRLSATIDTRQRLADGWRHPAPFSLPSVRRLALGKVISLPSAEPGHSTKNIFLDFGHQFFWIFNTLTQRTCWNMGLFYCILLYFSCLFHFLDYFRNM